MRNTIIILLALFAGTAFAQAPVIDSMLIDESKGILSVYGDFGTPQGKVWCDSVELPVLSWSTSLVTATIPDTGKGSAGGVVVERNSLFSNSRLITSWRIFVSFYSQHLYSQGAVESNNAKYYLLWRLDLHSVLVNKVRKKIKFFGNKTSSTNQYYSNDISHSHDVYDTNSYRYSGTLEIDKLVTNLVIGLQVPPVVGEFGQPAIIMDSSYGLTRGFVKSDITNDWMTFWDSASTNHLPPQKAIALQNNPSIIAPKDKRTNLGTDGILLQWNSLKYMDGYHIQLSKDSLVNGQRAGQAQQGVTYIVDTIVSSLDFTLPPLEKNTKYYWRVCGVNTEGESRWSEVWSFTTGTSTDVRQEQVKRISLACYPNPAMNELTIVTAEPTRLLLYDVTGKIIKSEQTISHETMWDVSLLPNGTYILGTSSGEMQVVQIVK